MITVPLHRHEVKLQSQRFELSAYYDFADDWRARLRLPYDIKRQRSRVEFVDPATPQEREAAIRNMELHHRNATYSGFADATLLVERRWAGVFGDASAFTLGAGTTLPIGSIERDPYVAGAEGRRHQHIQFGNGTFDPTLEAGVYFPLTDTLSARAFSAARLPFYENRHRFRGAIESTTIAGVSWQSPLPLSFRAGYGLFYQGFGHWDGDRDENTGIVAQFLLLGANTTVVDGLVFSFDVSIPVHERLLGGGDAFDQAIAVTGSFALSL